MNIQLPTTEIYLVKGSQGAHEDRTDWSICAYTSKDLAEQHVAKATEHMDALRRQAPARSIQNPPPYYDYWWGASSPWDPNGEFEEDTSYSYECVQLRGSLLVAST